MKHTLKAKYASDGIQAHRQRVEATQPAVVARQREAARRQEIVDRVSARFAESARPKVDANDVFDQATMASFRRAAHVNMAKRYSATIDKAMLDALKTVKPRDNDDQFDALNYTLSGITAARSGKSISPFDVIRPIKYTAVGAGRPDLLIMDDISC